MQNCIFWLFHNKKKREKKKPTSSMVFNHLSSHWQLCKQSGCEGFGSECWSTSLWPHVVSRQREASSGQASWDMDRVAQGTAALNMCSKHLQTYSSTFTLFLKFKSFLFTHFCKDYHYMGERNYRVKYKTVRSTRTTPEFGFVCNPKKYESERSKEGP